MKVIIELPSYFVPADAMAIRDEVIRLGVNAEMIPRENYTLSCLKVEIKSDDVSALSDAVMVSFSAIRLRIES